MASNVARVASRSYAGSGVAPHRQRNCVAYCAARSYASNRARVAPPCAEPRVSVLTGSA
ncbi:hypothetical protein OH687_11230 [Burkholderia anthina]|nr:hypothetical protein OH687_11230 [Burkholderia anthina]